MSTRLQPAEAKKRRSASAVKAAVTRAKTVESLTKESLLRGRLRSRSMAGAKAAALRREPALIAEGITRPTYKEIHPADYQLLEIPDYQRGIQADEVNELLRVLLAGGVIADPITLSRRKWASPDNKMGHYYIVDGQQRTLAHIEAGKTIKAMIYDCESLEAERQLFVTLNTQKVVSANNIIAASGNKVANFLREIDAKAEHPCEGRIVLKAGPGSGRRNLGASIVLRGIAIALGISSHSRGLTGQKLLPRIDDVFNAETADAYLRILAEITPEGDASRLRLLVAMALGKVFAEKAAQFGRVVVPSKQSLTAMKRANWEKITMGTWSSRYLPMVLEAVRERWHA